MQILLNIVCIECMSALIITLYFKYCRPGDIREFYFLRISCGGQIREFRNIAKVIIIIALLKETENSRIVNLIKSTKIRNSRRFKHAKIARFTV